MYCPSCGVAVAQGLTYCKNCGAKLVQTQSLSKSSEVKADLLVTSMVATFIFGLGVIAILMGVMRVILGLRVEPILVLMALPFLLMLILESVFLRLLLRRNRGAGPTSGTALSEPNATNELDSAQARSLTEGRAPSVTEHTTRAFDPIYTDRK